MLTIKVLGSGCANCKKLESLAREAAAELGAPAEVIKVTSFEDISKYPILATPGLVVNEQLLSSGRIPAKTEILGWLKQAAG